MPKARKYQINLSSTSYYHCVSRCVRRAYLCGEDVATGTSYEHRRKWVEDRIAKLAGIFAIQVCAYAVMHNHTHLVLHVDTQQAVRWSKSEVIKRWHKLFKGTHLSRQYASGTQRSELSAAHSLTLDETVKVWRLRLQDISWFMRSLNEYIARKANEEDDCTGRFWEGRFKTQALLDEAALLACMVYVELNPVRAGVSCRPETSLYTSYKKRFCNKGRRKKCLWLAPFSHDKHHQKANKLPFKEKDYFNLLQSTFRVRCQGGHKQKEESTLLDQLDINLSFWPEVTHNFEGCFHHAAGKMVNLIQYAELTGLKRLVDRKSASEFAGKQ